MSNVYDPRSIEARWQASWEEQGAFRAKNPGEPGFDPAQPKYYVLDMFPYPSGSGLHVGHPVGYIGSDIIARRKRMDGCNVLHPMGFDAFGLPAEQYAITTGKHPAETTAANMATFRRQLKAIGLSYDWSRELATCEPRYYKWTQWIFKRLWEKGLAYQAEVPVWWCEALKTVLANEEVINGRSERGDHPCERRPLKQWMFKITEYADKLLEDLDELDWPESVKALQKNWIGKSEGAECDFRIDGHDASLRIFTTRPDTMFGATFMVVAPEHELVSAITTDEQRAAVDAYVQTAANKSELERTDLAKEKSGVFTGAYCLNPAFPADDERAKIPIWVADYVLISYGTGAIMAVPGQDERDWEFAEQYGLNIVRTVQPPAEFDGKAYTGEGPAVNSGFLDGLGVAEAKAKMIAWLQEQGLGEAKTTYRLRDWLFSRQRYWGEPFPLVHHADGRISAVPDEQLPVELPDMEDFTPSDDGSPPLARATDWVATTDAASGEAVSRETDTMPGWAGSCWYYLRFIDPGNDAAAFSEEAERYWGNVDFYIGGVEHAVLHLLYARFWHKVLHELGIVSTREPFQKLFNQGMMTAFAYKDSTGRLVPSDEIDEGEDETATLRATGESLERVIAKMSKSLKNVINPDDVIAEHGADTFRIYEMFMGPLGDSKPWNTRDVPGSRRFLDRVWRMFVDPDGEAPTRPAFAPEAAGEQDIGLERALNRALQRVDDSFERLNFNTAIAGLMEFTNEVYKQPDKLNRDQGLRFVRALAPFAPHIAEELWARMGGAGLVAHADWPEVDAAMLVDDEIELVVQINGKLRGRAKVAKDASKDALEGAAREIVAEQLADVQVMKAVVVPGRLVNFVVKPN